MKAVTIYDIAREANVSVATVSRVLNHTAPVKKETRDKVVALIEKYQFQPNALARSLSKKSTGMIGVIIPDITNPFFPALLAGLEHEARSKGYTMFLCDTVSTQGEAAAQYERESAYLNALLEKQIDGMIWIGGRVNLARPAEALVREAVEVSKRIPLLFVNGHLPGTGIQRVYVDEKEGAALAAQYLIDAGHRRIAFAGGFAHLSNTRQRIQGFAEVMRANHIQLRKEWIVDGGFSVESGKQFLERLLGLADRPTAVLCANDLVAVGMLKAASKAGIRVPDELSLIGFDDIPYASDCIPELTTVSLKGSEVGRLAAEKLCSMIAANKTGKSVRVRPELIVRESVALLKQSSAARHGT